MITSHNNTNNADTSIRVINDANTDANVDTNKGANKGANMGAIDYSLLDFDIRVVDMVIYHKDCSDGFGAAYAIWKALNDVNPDIIYHGARHNVPPPDVTNLNVVICDFSYPHNILTNMINNAHKLIVLDHHETAELELANTDPKHKIFRKDYSGCGITWHCFHPGKPLPRHLMYIQDRDIWRKQYTETDAFCAVFYDLEMTFAIYDKYYNNDELIDSTIKNGKTILAFITSQVQRISKHVSCKFCKIMDKYYFVAICNSNLYKSDLGNHLVTQTFPNSDFAIIYNYDDMSDLTWFSLRSVEQVTNVGQLIKMVRPHAGGHPGAAGITLEGFHNIIPETTILENTGKAYFTLETLQLDTITINIPISNTLGLYLNPDQYINQNMEYKVAYLNNTYCKSEMGQYLVQKYDVDVAAVWNYNNNDGQTWYSIIFNNKLTKTQIELFIDKYSGGIMKESTYRLILPQYTPKLTSNPTQ